jgi:hypothetical protein
LIPTNCIISLSIAEHQDGASAPATLNKPPPSLQVDRRLNFPLTIQNAQDDNGKEDDSGDSQILRCAQDDKGEEDDSVRNHRLMIIGADNAD